jgi:hypothetical protein
VNDAIRGYYEGCLTPMSFITGFEILTALLQEIVTSFKIVVEIACLGLSRKVECD